MPKIVLNPNESFNSDIVLGTYADQCSYLKKLYKNKNTRNSEYLFMVMLNDDDKLINTVLLKSEIGLSLSVRTSELINSLKTFHPKKIIMTHNHPSQDCTPSLQDIFFTNQLADICSDLNIDLEDHIICTQNDFFSFKRTNLMKSKEILYPHL